MIIESWMVLSFCGAIFSIGLLGVLMRRNLIIMMMGIELMLNAANLTFVTYDYILKEVTGQMSVFFVIVVAAAEAAIGLGLLIAMFRNLRSVDTADIQLMRE
jgi:NADH-quinone oxidoreductase subunit K